MRRLPRVIGVAAQPLPTAHPRFSCPGPRRPPVGHSSTPDLPNPVLPEEGVCRAAVAGRAWPHARRSSRLDLLAHHLGLALGGRPGDRFAARLAVGLMADTLLRTVGRHTMPSAFCPWVAGVDDFAWRRNHKVDWFNNRRLLEPIGNVPPRRSGSSLLRPA